MSSQNVQNVAHTSTDSYMFRCSFFSVDKICFAVAALEPQTTHIQRTNYHFKVDWLWRRTSSEIGANRWLWFSSDQDLWRPLASTHSDPTQWNQLERNIRVQTAGNSSRKRQQTSYKHRFYLPAEIWSNLILEIQFQSDFDPAVRINVKQCCCCCCMCGLNHKYKKQLHSQSIPLNAGKSRLNIWPR